MLDTWSLVNTRVSARQYSAGYQSLVWRLSQAINVSLNAYQRRRTEEAGSKIEALLASDPNLKK